MTREELLKIAKPILFNTETVQEILEGRKTVTRRVIKNAEIEINNNYVYIHELNRQGERIDNVNCGFPYSDKKITEFMNINYAPYQIGDILYVKETWQEGYKGDVDGSGKPILEYLYRASGDDISVGFSNGKWKPSIHMPKKAARIFLKVTDVKVERLQDITKDYNNFNKEGIREEHGFRSEMHREFIDLWDSTIKKQDLNKYGWDANPWVWVIEFERVEEE